MIQPMPQITANIPSEEHVKRARAKALKADVSLREWAGQVLVAEIVRASGKRKKSAK